MGPRHIPDGKDFHEVAGAFPKDFGFSGSSEGYDAHPAAPPFDGDTPTKGPHTSVETAPEFAHGGATNHMHPHGHDVVKVHRQNDGSVVHHHSHGGYTIHHAGGAITHHAAGGEICHAMGGPIHDDGHVHDSSELAHRFARGGDVEQDKAMVKKGIHEHEDQEHHGEHSDIELARGGHPRLPRNMLPKVGHARDIGSEMPINRPPRNPMHSTTPRNAMPGGAMGYGVEPSAEPDVAGSDQGLTQLGKGGRARRRHHEE